MPTISTLTVDVVTNTRSLSRGLKLASTAVLAVGAIATKMALDYEDAFVKIAAVSNASAQDVEKWKEQVLDLAGETAQAPKELADALFFLASAGLKTSQIMPVLEASAQASAVGLGETADIAKLTANILNAYAGTGLKAADATDILVAAVREGSADTDEFSTAIGRILPIASAAGIGFDSVAASLASLSNIGLDVNEGVTAMRGLFQALVTPTDSAALAMESVGLSAGALLRSLRQDGLIATIRLLDTAVKGNTTTQAEYMAVLRDIVPNVRSLTGLLGLTSQEAERVNGVFGRVTDSTGSLSTALQTTAEGAGFKFRQALAEIQTLLIQLGDLLLPIFVSVVEFIQNSVAPAFEDFARGFGDVLAAAQPFFDAIGSILLPLFTKMFQILENNVLPALERLKPVFILIGGAVLVMATIILAQFALVVTAVGLVIDWISRIVEAFMKVVDWVRENLAEPVVDAVKKIIDALGDVIEWVRDRLVGAWKAAFSAMAAPIQFIIDLVQTLIGGIQAAIEWLGKLLENAPGGTIGVPGRGGFNPNLPGAATGGFVARTGAAIIHQGETIVPAGVGMGIQGDIVLQIDGKTLARITRDQLRKMGDRNAGTGL